MKITIAFESFEELAQFVLSASLLDFKSGSLSHGKIWRFQKNEMLLPTSSFWPLLSHVCEVGVGDITYTVKEITESENVDFKIFNYMLNDTQTENDSISIVFPTDGKQHLHGSQHVREFIEKCPDSFLLRVGWRTDYQDYIFRKK